MLADSTTPGRPRSRAEDDLNQFLDALVSGHAPKDGGLDPEITSAARHVHDLSLAPADQRLKREIWASLTAKEPQAHGPAAPPRIARSHRPVPRLAPADRPQTPTPYRLPQEQGRDRGAFATAALLVILMVLATGGFFILERPQSQRSASLPASHVATPAPSSLYIGHFARLTADIPSNWTVDPSGTFDYVGPDGFVRSVPVAGQSLRDACAAVAAPMARESSAATIGYPSWSGTEACRIDGELRGVAVAHGRPPPEPILAAGRESLLCRRHRRSRNSDGIAATIDFSPERVTPEAYAISLLDLVETRALWSHQLHWPTVRKKVLDFADGFETVEMARLGILSLITQYFRLSDDPRTSAVTPDRQTVGPEGFGALVIEQQVVLVYPGSPADQAGVRVGDRIEKIHGRPVISSTLALDANRQATIGGLGLSYAWPTATLTLLRPGTDAPIDVSITSAPYEPSPLPTGARIAGNVGQLMLPGVTQAEHEDDDVSTANEAMAQFNAAPVCGWIVDLRLAYASSYPPILASVGPLLGDGAVAAWQDRKGGSRRSPSRMESSARTSTRLPTSPASR